jgi:hypothetical protein
MYHAYTYDLVSRFWCTALVLLLIDAAILQTLINLIISITALLLIFYTITREGTTKNWKPLFIILLSSVVLLSLHFFLSIEGTKQMLKDNHSSLAKALSIMGVTFDENDNAVKLLFIFDGVYREEMHLLF